MATLLQRVIKFGLTGLVTTLVAYLVFVALLRVMHFVPAATISWVASVACGFLLNRRFTFGVRGADGRQRDFAVFLFGAGLQYCVAMVGYEILLGRLDMAPTPAFFINLIFTTAFSFGFHSLVTFRRTSRPQAPLPPPQ